MATASSASASLRAAFLGATTRATLDTTKSSSVRTYCCYFVVIYCQSTSSHTKDNLLHTTKHKIQTSQGSIRTSHHLSCGVAL